MDFERILGIISRRRALILWMAIVGVGLAAVLFVLSPRAYVAVSQALLIGNGAQGGPITTGLDLETLATSTSVMTAVRNDLGLGSNTSIEALQHATDAKVNFGSNVLVIAFTAPSRELAVKGANAVGVELAKYYREIANGRMSTMQQYLQGQLDIKRRQLDKVDAQLQAAIVRDPYNASSDVATTLGQQIMALDQSRDEIQATLVGEYAQSAAIAKQIAAEASIIRSEQLAANPLYTKEAEREATDAAQLALVQSQYKGSYPGLPGLEAQVAQEKRELGNSAATILKTDPSSPTLAVLEASRGSVDAKIAADRARMDALQAQVNATALHVDSLPTRDVAVTDLRRRHDLLASQYQQLAAQWVTATTASAQAASVGGIDVIDRAQSAAAALKHLLISVVSAFMGCAALGLALAFLLEVLDPRLRTIAGIERLYGRPVIATVRY